MTTTSSTDFRHKGSKNPIQKATQKENRSKTDEHWRRDHSGAGRTGNVTFPGTRGYSRPHFRIVTKCIQCTHTGAGMHYSPRKGRVDALTDRNQASRAMRSVHYRHRTQVGTISIFAHSTISTLFLQARKRTNGFPPRAAPR